MTRFLLPSVFQTKWVMAFAGVAAPRMIEFLIVTLSARSFTMPWMSMPSMTVFGSQIVMLPL